MYPRSTTWVRLTAMLSALVMIAAACGSSGDTEVASTTESSEPLSVGDPGAEAPADGPEFGSTLDEFLGADVEGSASSTPPDGFKEIQWEDLIPPGFSQAEISARFDERIAEVEPGTAEADAVYTELEAEYANQPVNPDIGGQDIQLAGFVAPLTYEGDLITEFLLVPYFGACVHVPPPPANQTVLVTLANGEGLTFDESWGAVWVTGTLTVDGATTDLAEAGYSISGAMSGVYDDY